MLAPAVFRNVAIAAREGGVQAYSPSYLVDGKGGVFEMAKLHVGDHVEIETGDLAGKDATVWSVDGNQVGVKYKFLGGCIKDLALFSSGDLKRLGTGGPCPVPVSEVKALEPQRPYCCEIMQDQLERESEDERYVRYLAQDDEIGLINRKDPDYYSPISYCPWCGKRIAAEPSDTEA
jgi:hypothetical protein